MRAGSRDAGESLRHILVRDLELPARIGVYQHERSGHQRIRVNLDVAVAEGDPAAIDDRLANVVDYERMVTGVRSIVAAGHVNLVETLAERIAALCLEDSRVRHVRVRVEKLEVFPDAASVGIEIERAAPR